MPWSAVLPIVAANRQQHIVDKCMTLRMYWQWKSTVAGICVLDLAQYHKLKPVGLNFIVSVAQNMWLWLRAVGCTA